MLNHETPPDLLVRLLRRVSDGDDKAFQELHALSRKRLLPFARRIVISSHIAEEVMQESFIAIWRDAGTFDATRAAPMTWMVTIVRHKAIDYLRANAQRDLLTDHGRSDGPLPAPDPADGPCERAELVQRSRHLRRGLAQLGELPRQAIELAFFQEMTHGEAALAMTAPLGSVKTWIRRGCRQIRLHLERPPDAVTASASRSRACSIAPPAKLPD